jgi:hypothetical protein
MEKSPIHETMRRLCKVMNEMNIRFAIAGAMAANAHGHRRTTADVDILIREEDLKRFKDRWIGLGWVNFPPPEQASQVSADGLPFITLPTLLELKLASGMTAPHRVQDLADVIQLIRVNQLPDTYGEQLNPYVR